MCHRLSHDVRKSALLQVLACCEAGSATFGLAPEGLMMALAKPAADGRPVRQAAQLRQTAQAAMSASSALAWHMVLASALMADLQGRHAADKQRRDAERLYHRVLSNSSGWGCAWRALCLRESCRACAGAGATHEPQMSIRSAWLPSQCCSWWLNSLGLFSRC